MKSARAHGTVRALDVVKLGKVMTSRMRASRDLQGTIDLQSKATFRHKTVLPLLLHSSLVRQSHSF